MFNREEYNSLVEDKFFLVINTAQYIMYIQLSAFYMDYLNCFTVSEN